MPVCQDCGGSYDNEFKFCPHCGRAKPEASSTNTNVTSDIYEQCHIVWDYKTEFPSTEVWFWAKAIDNKGVYSAGTSPRYKIVFIGYKNKDQFGPHTQDTEVRRKANAVHMDLVHQLVSEGWEPVSEQGNNWWEYRFRRKMKT